MAEYSDNKIERFERSDLSESDYSESDLDNYQDDDYDESLFKEEHYVIKRNGNKVETDFNKINERLILLATKIEPKLQCNVTFVTQKTIATVVTGSKTTEIDEHAALISDAMSIIDPDFGDLAGRIAVSNHQKNTVNSFSDTMERLYNNKDYKGTAAPRLNDKFIKFVRTFSHELDVMIDHKRDFSSTYFGFNTMVAKYLMKRSLTRDEVQMGKSKEDMENRPQDYALERPQYMWLRCACALKMNKKNIKDNSVLKIVKQVYDALSLGYISLATPMLFNLGSVTEQLLSCFLTCCEDSANGIKLLEWKLSLISKNSGGVAWWWNLRSAGAEIKSTNGHSSGPLNFMKSYEMTANNFDQGGKRPGSFAHYIQPQDPLFPQWIKFKRKNYKDKMEKLFYGIMMPDLFMQYLERAMDKDEPVLWYFFDSSTHSDLLNMNGDEFKTEYEKRVVNKEYHGEPILIMDLWNEMITTWEQTSTPYVVSKDQVNKKSNQMNSGTINCSNLCVTGDTKILTKKGWRKIKNFEDKKISIWNGEEWSRSLVKKTAENAKILKIKFSDGSELKCTPEHKFIVIKGAGNNKSERISAKDLVLNKTRLVRIPELPIIDGDGDFKYPYTHGFFCGDGTYAHKNDDEDQVCQYNSIDDGMYCGRHQDFVRETDIHNKKCQARIGNRALLQLYGEKKDLLKHFDYDGEAYKNGVKLAIRLKTDIAPKYEIPHNCSLDIKLKWFAGLCDSDGTMQSNCIVISSIDKEFLINIKLLCQTMGVNPKVTIMREACKKMMPDGKGGKAEYNCKQIYRLILSSLETYDLYQLGLVTHRLKYNHEAKKPNRDATHFTKAISIEELDERQDTYCFNEPLKHQGMFNGLLTGNCTEIMEITKPTKYDKYGNVIELGEFACCCLGTLCLPKFVKITYTCDNKHTVDGKDYPNKHKWNCSVIREIDHQLLHEYSKFGHEILDDIIDINDYIVPECENSNKRHRPVSMGIMGLADAFLMMRLPFTSPEAKQINKDIAETRAHGAWERSWELAVLRDPYPSFREGNCKYGPGCPMANGIFQWQMWGITEDQLSGRWDWNTLRENGMRDGYRNSLCIGNPPTATTSQIQGLNECFEPYSSNIYVRETNIGENLIVNKHLLKELIERNLWNPKMKRQLINAGGSVQNLPLPDDIKELYKTAFELKGKDLIDMMVGRDSHTDQSSSNNHTINDPSPAKITSLLFYAWRAGLKTLSYYMRFYKSDVKAQVFSESITTPDSVINTPNVPAKKIEPYFMGSCTDAGCTI